MTNAQETKLISKVFRKILKVKRSNVTESGVIRISNEFGVNPDYIQEIGKFNSY